MSVKQFAKGVTAAIGVLSAKWLYDATDLWSVINFGNQTEEKTDEEKAVDDILRGLDDKIFEEVTNDKLPIHEVKEIINNAPYYITSLKHQSQLGAGDVYDGSVYHQSAKRRANFQWSFEPSSTVGTWRIKDLRHNKFLGAGDQNDGYIHHQNHGNRVNFQWKLIPVKNYQAYKNNDEYKNAFFLVNDKSEQTLVAGNVKDNNVYLQPHNWRDSALWLISKV
jgi:hypothetical protein